MNTLTARSAKQLGLHNLAILILAVLLLLPACAGQPQPAGVEEITIV